MFNAYSLSDAGVRRREGKPRNTLNTRKRRWLMFSRVEHVERVEGRGFVDGNNFDN